MARRRRRNRKARRRNVTRRSSMRALRLARSAARRATRKNRKHRRNPGRRVGRFTPTRGFGGRRVGRFTPPSMNPGLARYRGAMKNRGLFGRAWRRNSDDVAASVRATSRPVEKVKDIGVTVLRTGIGFSTSMVMGHVAAGLLQNTEYGPLVGNVLTVVAAELATSKVAKARELMGAAFSGGAALGAYVNLMSLAVSKGLIPASIAPYIAPWAEVPVAPMILSEPPAPAVTDAAAPAATGAYIAQQGLYGTPMESAMQHRLKMIESGMSGGIFDAKTTLGEYDLLETAPAGTNVQGALAAYEVYPPSVGSVDVRAATAGLGAQVEEAFAGLSGRRQRRRGLREYVSVPLNDYVPTGGNVAYFQETQQGKAIFGEIRDAARRITAKRISEGKPVDAQFQADLVKAAQQVAGNGEKDVSMAAPGAPLTVGGAPFPGSSVMPVGGVGGQPVAIGEDMQEDGGIFG